VESVQQHIDLVGEGVLVVIRAEGLLGRAAGPLELWPVRPDRITPVPDPETFLAGYVYTGPDGEQVPLGLDEVIHIKMPNPLDPYRGLGPVQAAMVDLDSARYSAEWNRNFFLNSAEPGGVIEIPGKLSDEDYDEMVERWREQHQGVSAAHRVAIVEHGKWVSTTFSQRDMQFAELRNVSREILREAFGIHGHMLGLSQDVNKANAEAGEVSFARWLVSPRAQRWKGELNMKLLPMFGETAKGLELDHCKIVPEDREADDRERTSKASAAASLVGAGWNADNVLETVGLPPMTFDGAPEPAPTF
jgi:HK97 family phage portal protein